VGYSGKLEEKKLALKLRGEGCSYSEIQKKVPVYKSTLSYWCRDVILTQAQMERLRKKKLEGSERGRFIGSKILQERRVRETRRVIEEGIKEGIKEKLDEISCLARETRGDWTDPRANMREICSLSWDTPFRRIRISPNERVSRAKILVIVIL